MVGVLAGLAMPAAASPLVPWLVKPSQQVIKRHTGLPLMRAVPVVNDTEEQVRAHLMTELDKQLAGVDVPAMVELSVRHGWFPSGIDLRKIYVDLYSSQAAAFYDTRSGVFHNITRGGALETLSETVVVAHELTHAAQDQAVPAQGRLDTLKDDDDRQRALMWVMEGQATLVGNRVGHIVGPPLPGPLGVLVGELETIFTWTSAWKEAAPKAMAKMGATAPPFIMEGLWTPYTEGSRFAWFVERVMGRRAHAAMLCRPPASTEQMMHPEKYLRRQDPPRVVHLSHPQGARPRSELTQGEWALQWLLRQQMPEAAADDVAAGWGGDRMALYPDGSGVWRLVMDTVGDAKQLEDALGSMAWPVPAVIRRTAAEVQLFTATPMDSVDAWSAQLSGLQAAPLDVTALDQHAGVCSTL